MKPEIQCRYCKKLTKNRNFCSRKCSNTYHRGDRAPNPPKSRTCKKCGGEYTCSKGYRSEAYCEPCRSAIPSDLYKSYTLEQVHSSPHLKNKHPSWINAQVRGFNRQWNKNLLGLPCAYCGYEPHVELCHRKPISKFPKTATLGEINHPSNVVQLCRNHHWELDHGLLVF